MAAPGVSPLTIPAARQDRETRAVPPARHDQSPVSARIAAAWRDHHEAGAMNVHGTGFVVIAPGGRDPGADRRLVMAGGRNRPRFAILPRGRDGERADAWRGHVGDGGPGFSFCSQMDRST